MRCLWIGLLALLLVGCGVGSSLTDFTAYYNTFYNAQRVFDEGTAALSTIDEPVDPERYLTLFPGGEHIQQPEKLEQAIEKSADVLRDHPRSRWVDPALMLIGKSYFYLENFGGAEQNFREVIERGSGDVDAAHVWLGRTLVAAGHYDRAAEHLQQGLSQVETARAEALLRLVQGELRVQQQNWSGAAEALTQGLEGEHLERSVQARASFLLGQVYEALEAYDRAYEAYEAARQQQPRYELAFAAQVGMIRVQSRSGDLEGALARLERMEQRSAHREKRPELAYRRGRLYQEHGQIDRAREAFHQLLHDREEVPPPGDVEGRAHYALGELYRDADSDFVRASAHFDSAAAALGGPSDESVRRLPRTQQDIADAARQADRFRDVARATQRLERLDSLLALGALDEAAFEAFVEELRQQRLQELQQARRAEQERQQQRQFGVAGGLDDGDGSAPMAASTMGEAGFLFHRSPARVQENRARFIQRWGPRPRVPNWRRQNALSEIEQTTTLAASSAAASEEELEEMVQPELTIEGVQVDLSDVPRDPASREALRRERAEARYELANALFLSVEQPDSAAVWYHRVIEEDGEAPVALRAHYALGELYRDAGREAEARRHYQIVVEQGEQPELAARAQERLQGTESASAGPPLGEDRSEAAYAQSYAVWQDGRLEEAFRGMMAAAAAYPEQPVAPRALLAAGRIALEWAVREGWSRRAPLPVALSDSLRRPGGLLAVLNTRPDSEDRIGNVQAEQVLRVLTERYPDAPHADQAHQLLAALEEIPLPDEEQERPPVAADMTADRAEEPDAEEPTSMSADLQLQQGDWTVVVASEPSRSAAEIIANDYRTDGYRAGVLDAEVGGNVYYRVVIERFDTQAQGLAALAEEADLPEDAWLYRLPAVAEAAPVAPEQADALEEGAWTIVVASEASQRTAETIAEHYRREDFQSRVLTVEVGGQVRYRVVVEQFETLEEGRAALAEAATFPDDAWLSRLSSSSSDIAADSRDETAEESDAPENTMLYGEAPLDWSQGGWTIVVASPTSMPEAGNIAERYRAEGFRADVLTSNIEGEIRHRVVLGRFSTRTQALAAYDQLRGSIPAESWLLNIPSERN